MDTNGAAPINKHMLDKPPSLGLMIAPTQ